MLTSTVAGSNPVFVCNGTNGSNGTGTGGTGAPTVYDTQISYNYQCAYPNQGSPFQCGRQFDPGLATVSSDPLSIPAGTYQVIASVNVGDDPVNPSNNQFRPVNLTCTLNGLSATFTLPAGFNDDQENQIPAQATLVLQGLVAVQGCGSLQLSCAVSPNNYFSSGSYNGPSLILNSLKIDATVVGQDPSFSCGEGSGEDRR